MKPRWKFFALIVVSLLTSVLVSPLTMARDLEQQAQFATPILVANTSFLNVRTGPGVQYSVLVTVVGGTELSVLGRARDNVWFQVATNSGAGWVNVEFTLPRGDFARVPVVSVDAPAQNLGQGGGGGAPTGFITPTTQQARLIGLQFFGGDLWSEPRYDSLVIRRGLAGSENIIYPLQNLVKDAEGGTWYLINYPNIGLGWVNQGIFRLLSCGVNEVFVPIGTPLIRFDGISNQSGYPLPQDAEFYVRGRQNEFAVIELADSTIGLVNAEEITPRSKDIVSVCADLPSTIATSGQGGGGGAGSTASTVPVQPIASLPVAVVNTGNLNVRSGPSAGFSVVATVPGGASLNVIGRAKDNVWLLVEGNFGRGWVNSEFVLFRGVYANVPLVTTEQAAGLITAPNLGQGGGGGATGVSTTTQSRLIGLQFFGGDLWSEPRYDSLIIRRGLAGSENIIYPLQNLVRDADGGVWYQINYPNIGTGWVNQGLLRLLSCGVNEVFVPIGTPLIRFDGISNQSGYPLPQDAEFYVRGRQNEFAVIELTDGTRGLVNAEEITPRSKDVVSVCADLPSSIATSGQGGGGGAPTVSGGAIGAAVTGNRVVVNTGNLNVRSGPSAGFSVVATVPGGTTLAVVGRARDNVWLLVEGDFGRGWLNIEFVLFRGVYDTVPVVDR